MLRDVCHLLSCPEFQHPLALLWIINKCESIFENSSNLMWLVFFFFQWFFATLQKIKNKMKCLTDFFGKILPKLARFGGKKLWNRHIWTCGSILWACNIGRIPNLAKPTSCEWLPAHLPHKFFYRKNPKHGILQDNPNRSYYPTY
jgi:hypothetical protein